MFLNLHLLLIQSCFLNEYIDSRLLLSFFVVILLSCSPSRMHILKMVWIGFHVLENVATLRSCFLVSESAAVHNCSCDSAAACVLFNISYG